MGQQQLGGALGEQHQGGDDRQHVGGHAVQGKVTSRFLQIIKIILMFQEFDDGTSNLASVEMYSPSAFYSLLSTVYSTYLLEPSSCFLVNFVVGYQPYQT
jgi:hypothetical protein